MSQTAHTEAEPRNLPATQEAAPPPPRTIMAGGKLMPIVAQSMSEAYRMGEAVCAAGLAPAGMESPEACMIAIMMGAEVGLTPMASVQRIAVINKRPTIWGDAAIGLVRASGLLEDFEETIGEESASCTVHRRGERRPVTRTFTKNDAIVAGLWGKAGPWKNYPKRMLQMRARAFALRDVFPDVLGGLYIAEELQGGDDARDVTPAAPPAPKAPAVPRAPSAVVPFADRPKRDRKPKEPEKAEQELPIETATVVEPDPLPLIDDYPKALKEWTDSFELAETPEDLRDFWSSEVQPYVDGGLVHASDVEDLERAFNTAMAKL
jgi:hypothetical protein